MAKLTTFMVFFAIVLCANAVPVPQFFDPFSFVMNAMSSPHTFSSGSQAATFSGSSSSGGGKTMTVMTQHEAGKPSVTQVIESDNGNIWRETFVGK